VLGRDLYGLSDGDGLEGFVFTDALRGAQRGDGDP
jgi:hypothetical protein